MTTPFEALKLFAIEDSALKAARPANPVAPSLEIERSTMTDAPSALFGTKGETSEGVSRAVVENLIGSLKGVDLDFTIHWYYAAVYTTNGGAQVNYNYTGHSMLCFRGGMLAKILHISKDQDISYLKSQEGYPAVPANLIQPLTMSARIQTM